MKIRILSKEALEILKDKRCIEQCLNKYSNYTTNEWLDDICGESPFVDTKYNDLPDISFDMTAPEGKEFETEFNNVKELYSRLNFISDSNASEERLWAGLSLDIGYQYVQYRWKPKTVNSIAQHFYFDMGYRRSYTRNAMARLWWVGRLTYDQDRDDPYELTRFVCQHSDYIFNILERNTSNSLHVLRPFIETIKESMVSGIELNTDDIGELSKYLNLLGGIYILDFMPEEWIKDKIRGKIDQICDKSAHDTYSAKDSGGTKRVGPSSRVVIKADKAGTKMVIVEKKNKLKTIPKSIIGLRIGDSIKIGKVVYHIVDIT